jgi:sugar/nucleoside kinase (ribokinase family)
MDVLIVGSVALDDVRTPFGEVKDALGGSAVYASLAASYFARVGVVGVVGQDFPEAHRRLLASRGVRLEGLETASGQTFHWSGFYEQDLSSAHTLDTRLNVFAHFVPKVPETFRGAPYLFLANIDPDLQASVLDQVPRPRFTLLDTMNYWIEQKRESLLRLLPRVDMLVVNDAEARQLSGTSNLLQAVAWLKGQGLRGVTVKKGEHGALVSWEDKLWVVPAVPLEEVRDPTGAGDTFAGGFIGALALQGDGAPDPWRTAATLGTVLASFTVGEFSVQGLARLEEGPIRERYLRLRELACVHEFPGWTWSGPATDAGPAFRNPHRKERS